LLTVCGVTFVVVALIVMMVAKSKSCQHPVKIGIGVGGLTAIVAYWGTIMAIAAHRM
jgi:hypothetical protein